MRESAPLPAPPWSGLPLLSPPRSVWPQLQDSLASRARRRRWPWLALAAGIVVALFLPQVSRPPSQPTATAVVAPVEAPDDSARLHALMTESAQLEALIAWSREEHVEVMSTASLGAALEERIERVDLLLARPDADPGARLPLWQERVLRLRQLAGLQSAEHLLAANGDTEPGTPVLAF
jgi:hypothetical protein